MVRPPKAGPFFLKTLAPSSRLPGDQRVNSWRTPNATINPPQTRSIHARYPRYPDAIPACDRTSATKPYHVVATNATMASIAANVTGDICAGVAEAKMAAKNATDFGFLMFVAKPCTNALRNPPATFALAMPDSPARALRIS